MGQDHEIKSEEVDRPTKTEPSANMRTKRSRKLRDLVGAIDQGTSSTRFLVFENRTGLLVASSQIEVKRIVPDEGWVEIDPKAIMDSVYATIEKVSEQLDDISLQENQKGSEYSWRNRLKCIGICNQRESTVVWDKYTGKALYNVIVWMDNRTKDIVDQMIDSIPGRDFNWLKDKTGLPMSTYFSAFKLKWLIDNVHKVKEAIRNDRLLFGTVDSWILWNLTGQHKTDVTNASRTFLMDIKTLKWDSQLCNYFNIPQSILPEILSSADFFGKIKKGPLEGLPITGVIGDQSAALFGHGCLHVGQTKATFGTGCFIMQNVGSGPINGTLSGLQHRAKKGLITTVGFKLRDRPVCYALEGSIKIAGAALTWLRDNLQLIQDYEECDKLIDGTKNAANVFFVPALGGLYAPYWDPNAAGLYIGLSQFTRREHLVRATFDSIAFQTNDILSLMKGVTSGLMIDGGLCKSKNLCQIMADITGIDIVRPSMCETSALGAAMVAACGANIWSFDSMLAQAARAPLENAANRNHYYPHAALHHEEKFCSLIRTKSECIAAKNVNNYAHNGAEKLFAGGGINDDAGGGSRRRIAQTGSSSRAQTMGAPAPQSDDENEEPWSDIDDENDREDSVSIARTTSINLSSSTDQDTATETIAPEFQSAGDELSAAVMNEDLQSDRRQNSAASNNEQETMLQNQARNYTTSSGYSSGSGGDNFELVGSMTDSGNLRRDSPVAQLRATDSFVNNCLYQQDLEQTQRNELNQPEQSNCLSDFRRGASQISAASLTNNELNDNGNKEQEITSALDYDDEADDNLTSSDENDLSPSHSNSNLADTKVLNRPLPLSKPADVFQSYISVEHRVELVQYWRRAVERSMKWTKIEHEEIRRIDYQRLSSLPISMYLFLSVGIVALSSVCSAFGIGRATS